VAPVFITRILRSSSCCIDPAMLSASLNLWKVIQCVPVVIAIRDNDVDLSRDMLSKETTESYPHLWSDIQGRFTRISNNRPQIGSFGVTWLVTDTNLRDSDRADEVFALKLFHVEEQSLLTIKSTLEHDYQQDMLAGYKECKMQKHLVAEGERTSHIGAQRFISCHETNIPPEHDERWTSGLEEEPLWILMENGGAYTLFQWIHSQRWTADLAKNTFKQLMEGLSFLASISPALTHHDLKPENCVIKETHDGKHVLNIIDFGGAAEIARATRFGDFLTATPGYVPWEFRKRISSEDECPPTPGQTLPQNFASCPSDSCGSRCGLAFDIFAAGQIWLNMMLGDPSDTWGYPADSNHPNIEVSKVIEGFEAQKERRGYRKFHEILEELNAETINWEDMKISVDKMLLHDPDQRIQAQEMLGTHWMEQIETPDEKQYLRNSGQHVLLPKLSTIRKSMMRGI